jgi:hypothetical protein
VSTRRRILAAIAVLAAVALVLILVLNRPGHQHAASTGPPLPTERVTIVQDDAQFFYGSDAQVAADARQLTDLGADWLRVTASWSVIAPAPDSARKPHFDATNPSAYPKGAWSRLDRVFAQAHKAGLKVMVDIAFWAPRWAVGRGLGEKGQERWDVDPAAYADFAEAVARRYPQAVAFAIWNEPNYRVFFLPQNELRDGKWVPASPHRYRAMLYAAAAPARGAAPHSLLLIGNTAAGGVDKPDSPEQGVSPMTFLREMACVDRNLKPLRIPECKNFQPLPGDGFAHHPYTQNTVPGTVDPDPDAVRVAGLGKLDALLGRLRKAGRTQRRLGLFVTEYGYETNPPDPTQPWTPADQANLLPDAELTAEHSAPDLRSWAQFLLRDLGPRPGPAATRWSDFQSGLEFADGTRKPAYASFRLALVLRPAPAGELRVEGRVRPRRARGAIKVEGRLLSGRWAPATGTRPVRTDRDGFFAVVLRPSAITALRVRAGSIVSRTLELAGD